MLEAIIWGSSPAPTRQGCGHDELRARTAKNGRAAALVQRIVFILFIFIEHAHCVMVSDRSKGDDPDEATSDVTLWKPARQLTLGHRTCNAVAVC
jgi:hypothetical protein